MIDALVLVLLVATGALAVYGVALTLLGRAPDRWTRIAVGVVVGLIALQAVIALVRMFTGAAVGEPSTFVIYLVVAVCVLPIALQYATAEPTRWGGTVIAVAAVATGVAVLRLDGLWALSAS